MSAPRLKCLTCGDVLRPQYTLARREKMIEFVRKHYSPEAAARDEATIRETYELLKNNYGKVAGLFCTDRCAINFGIAAARSGWRPEGGAL